MTNTNLCQFGELALEALPGHIHLSKNLPPFYDFAPWRLIADLVRDQIRSGQLTCEPTLIDIGANIGDSAALWRNHFASQVTCIEPSERFYGLLQKNSKQIGNCVLVKKLYNASMNVNLLRFTSDDQTGSTEVCGGSEIKTPLGRQSFNVISLEEILELSPSPSVLKTDTDGFDVPILRDVFEKLGASAVTILPIIFTEGPTSAQMESIDSVMEACDIYGKFIALGYSATVFTNFGHLYCHCGPSIQTLVSCFLSLRQGIINRRTPCHYFDIVFSTNNSTFEVVQEYARIYTPSNK